MFLDAQPDAFDDDRLALDTQCGRRAECGERRAMGFRRAAGLWMDKDVQPASATGSASSRDQGFRLFYSPQELTELTYNPYVPTQVS
ncbi:hypothetical protein QF034_004301 [Streptomyces africanus]|uniref:Uncharacterized protein n=1 Tax=Streptomyces africanus TaxID=231024 RepID=A0ABU0QSW2_9ACTN|nr:hypothetical protein [Streptomyces africanus]MDQ0750070.1 hypothetical protein [Streptomyces africanus]